MSWDDIDKWCRMVSKWCQTLPRLRPPFLLGVRGDVRRDVPGDEPRSFAEGRDLCDAQATLKGWLLDGVPQVLRRSLSNDSRLDRWLRATIAFAFAREGKLLVW
eukprot:gene12685-biopygen7321